MHHLHFGGELFLVKVFTLMNSPTHPDVHRRYFAGFMAVEDGLSAKRVDVEQLAFCVALLRISFKKDG